MVHIHYAVAQMNEADPYILTCKDVQNMVSEKKNTK